jgi:hypothetical protein
VATFLYVVAIAAGVLGALAVGGYFFLLWRK